MKARSHPRRLQQVTSCVSLYFIGIGVVGVYGWQDWHSLLRISSNNAALWCDKLPPLAPTPYRLILNNTGLCWPYMREDADLLKSLFLSGDALGVGVLLELSQEQGKDGSWTVKMEPSRWLRSYKHQMASIASRNETKQYYDSLKDFFSEPQVC